MISHRRHRLTVALLFACAAPVALAQDGDTATTLDSIEVVAERAVTATKTDTAVVETPQAVSVVPSELFAQRGALNLQETLRYTAGVTAESYGLDTRGESFFVRSVDPTQYLDGMRKVYNYSPIPRIDVYTLDRVEVLRGPSSMLYGQGAAGGIVNAISKRPESTFGGEVGVQFGSFDRTQLQADVTGALDEEGDVAARLVAVARNGGMQTDELPDDRLVLAPSMTWRLGDHTDITLLAQYQRDRSGSSQQFLPVAGTLLAPAGRRLDPSTFLGDKDYDRLESTQSSATLLLEHRFNDSLTGRSSIRYADIDTTFQELYPDVFTNPANPFTDTGLLNRYAYAIKPHLGILTSDHSLQYGFVTGPLEHKLLAGVDYSDFQQRSQSAFCPADPAQQVPSGCLVPAIDPYNPVSSGVVGPAYVTNPKQRNTQLGVYLQDQIRYADRVSLVLGVRRDRARSQTEGSPEQTDKETSYRIGVIGDVGKGFSPYVSYAESFLPVAGLDFYTRAFKPMRGKQVEAGVKWVPTRGALFTANAYRIVETNRTTNDPNNVLNVIQTGEIRSQGVELEAAYAIGDDFLVTGSVAYNDAEVTESNFAHEVGVQLSDTPKRLASVWVSKRFALGDALQMRVGLGGRHVGPTLSTTAAGSLETPGYTLADALVSFDWTQWSLTFNATNLFDKEYFAPCRAFGDCFTGNTRTMTGSVVYRF